MMNSRTWNSQRNKKTLNKIAFIIILILIALYMVVPIYILVKVSFGTTQEVMTQHPTLLPHSITLEHWKTVLSSGNVQAPLIKSLIVSTTATAIAILIVAPAAYAISRLNRKVKLAYIMTLFFTKMFPTVGIALPISVRFLSWNLLDTNVGLILADLIGQIPFMAWILVSTFSAIPIDLEEAAQIDGASRMQTLLRVVFPVAAQGIAVSAMYVWLNCWNEFTYALYLSLTTKTLPLMVYYYTQRSGMFETAAYSTILAIPVIIVTFILQRYLKSDYLSGAVKG
ncbi:MAG: carbohydrate ABC transporter permease [Lachnospiraceae bacterium]|nr:carbohydrate ABC transporter permease [Lachnospiraceae bacterium]